MAIIKRKRGNVIYLYEKIYAGFENGRRKYKEICLGHLDEDGNLIPSKKNRRKAMKNAPAELVLKTTTTKVIVRPKPIEPEIVTPPEVKKPARTKAIADKKNGDLTPCPECLAVPTLPNYEHSISLHQEGKAYLQNLISTDGLEFKDGKMYFKGALEPISTVELQDMRTNKGIEEIDIPLLTMYYSIILASFQEKIKQGIDFRKAADMITRIYAPDFMRCLETLGKGSGANENNVSNIMSKTRAFHNIIGIHHIKRNGRPDKSYFPVMNFEGYDSKTNTISFFSPYLNYIVREIYSASIKYDKKGQPRLKRSGQPMLYPSNSFLIRPSIVSERNKTAVENVMIIVKVIEQAGDNGTPHIRASTIVERNEALKLRLSKDTHPFRLLKRVFKRTWELLRAQTTLQETYKDIELPDPEDKKNIPTPSNLDKVIFAFPHKGKNSSKGGSEK